jgi:hypothetical protein
MSEQKTFMQQLDDWSNANVIVPLTRAVQADDEKQYHEAAANVEKAIREKVLESYRNGQAAGPQKSNPHSKRRRGQGRTCPLLVLAREGRR